MAEARKTSDYKDLQDEVAGHDNGRTKRFLPENHIAAETRRRKREEERQFRTTLEMMMRNPEYAALYKETEYLLIRAEQATERALEQAEKNLLISQQQFQEMMDNASKLPNGTAVFKDEDGNARTLDGGFVSDVDAASVVWKEGSLTYKQAIANQGMVGNHSARIDRLREYQVDVLGDIRHRIDNNDGSITKDDFTEMQKDIVDRADSTIQNTLNPQETDFSTDTSIAPSAKPQI